MQHFSFKNMVYIIYFFIDKSWYTNDVISLSPYIVIINEVYDIIQ